MDKAGAMLTDISIHSPRMGRDGVDQLRLAVLYYFNPLSPHGERPVTAPNRSTTDPHFNPLSPHGERRAAATGAPSAS